MYIDKLKNLRERIGITQQESADLLGIVKSQYCIYEKEYATIPIKHLLTLCNYYKVSLDYIFSFTDNKEYKVINPDGDKKISSLRLKDFRIC